MPPATPRTRLSTPPAAEASNSRPRSVSAACAPMDKPCLVSHARAESVSFSTFIHNCGSIPVSCLNCAAAAGTSRNNAAASAIPSNPSENAAATPAENLRSSRLAQGRAASATIAPGSSCFTASHKSPLPHHKSNAVNAAPASTRLCFFLCACCTAHPPFLNTGKEGTRLPCPYASEAFGQLHHLIHLTRHLPLPFLVSRHQHRACTYCKAQHSHGSCFEHVHFSSSSPKYASSCIRKCSSFILSKAEIASASNACQLRKKRFFQQVLFSAHLSPKEAVCLVFAVLPKEMPSCFVPCISSSGFYCRFIRHDRPFPVRRMNERQQASPLPENKGGIPLCKRPLPTKDASGQPH